MNTIEATRELGKALQAEPSYQRLKEVSTLCDADKELQDMIGSFNLARMNLNNQMKKDPREPEKEDELNKKVQSIYDDIMKNPNMVIYAKAEKEVDALLKQVYGIIEKCAQGEDPETAEYNPCTHDCSSCGGCH